MGLADLFSDSNEQKARNALIRGYKQGEQRAGDALGQGYSDLKDAYGNAIDVYSPYADAGGSATSLYADALGLNGAEAAAAAQGKFSASPGYQYAVDQALQSLERRASSRGALGGGGLSADSLNTVYGIANQDYGSWLDRLNGLSGQGLQAANGQSGVYTGLGNAGYQYGSDLGNLYWNSETGQANANADYQKGKDQTGANIFGAITGGLSLGAKILGLGG